MVITKEHIILSAIYNFRCLKFNQIMQYCFSDCSERTCCNILSKMGKKGTIEKVGFRNDSAYYTITSAGIKHLRDYGLVPVDKNKHHIVQSGKILSASSIALNPQYTAHQLALNQFVLDFISLYPEIEFDYYDEKYISQVFSNIRPDGIIKTKDCLYFLEMDMNTEREARLMKKWNSYRSFLHSEDYYVLHGDIKVLFILDNISDKSGRKYLLREYIDRNLRADICPEFDLYIGKNTDLLPVFRGAEDISELLYKQGFSVKRNVLIENLPQYSYLITNGTMSFVVDDYTRENMFIFKKATEYPKCNAIYNQQNSCDMQYIIITRNEAEAYKLKNQTFASSLNIYFTTKQRLKDYTFCSALFQIESDGILYHFADEDLRIRRKEAYIKNFF